MRSMLKRAALAVAATMALVGVAHAQQPVKIVVGFAPGGTTDVIARQIANDLANRLGRTVIVENRPGASGNIAANMVAKSPPDGETLLFVPSSHATNATLYSNLRFDTKTDFSAIGLVAATPYVLMVNPSLPVRTVPELVAHLKANPGKLAYASASAGTAQHLAAELFKKSTATDILHVPYKGSAAALPDVMSGITPMIFDNITMALPLIKSGSLRPVAVTTTKRSPMLPEIPTVAEGGVPGFDVSGWFALLGPAKMNRSTVDQLNKALNAGLRDPALVAKFRETGAEAIPSSPEEAEALIDTEIAKWRTVIQAAKINLN